MSRASIGSGLLDGRVALVTGGVGVIGQAIARRLTQHGARVVIADLDRSACEAVASRISAEAGGQVIGLPVDITDHDSLDVLTEQAMSMVGVIDIVAVNAGVLVAALALETDRAAWDRALQVNLTGSFLTATTLARPLIDAGLPGSIILTSSLFGLRGGRGNAAYSSTKFGLIGLTQTLAAEFAPHGIRVNAVCPGQIQSDMMDTLFQRRAEERGTSPDAERARFLERIPLGRLGDPDEVADGFVYLASSLSSYVTGHALLIDGGWQVA